ncbi:MAG: chromosomal replication initiator protein DnaA [Chitinispirillia bacterium]|jgi:chromosomal replication initiator protein
MDKSTWNEIRQLIKQSIDSTRFDTWISPINIIEQSDEHILHLEVKNKFLVNFLEQHYKTIILSFSRKVNPQIEEVKFIPKKKYTNTINKNSVIKKINIPHKTNLNSNYTFDIFVTGPGNEFAKSVSIAVAENPGKTKFNPLLIYGGVGLGKTHLLHAIGNHIIKKTDYKNLIFSTSEEFYYNFIEAIKNSNTKLFSERYQRSDIILIDDIQFIAGKERTQEEFFYIFNTLHQQGKQIVLTSDSPPNSIKGLHDRLVSRFQWGLYVDIQPPDLETRVAILKMKAERDNLNLPDEIFYYIAENISSNIRELEGTIIRILAFASITKSDITLDLVKSILSDSIIKKEKKKISIDNIIDTVSKYYKIPTNNLREKNRSKEVAHCRQVAMYISKMYTNFSLKSIGLHFGGRDHSTVIHAVKQISKNKDKDKILMNDINYILSKLGN